MANMLVIGLGGTGTKILTHLKAILVAESPTRQLPDSVQLLALDTTERADYDTLRGVFSEDYLLRGSEYFSLIGDCTDWVCGNPSRGEPGIAGYQNDEHFMRPWFEADWFSTYSPALLAVTNGAGMYRQIGRLALFNHLRAGTASPLYQLLLHKMQKLPQNPITVVVTGSLAGGTGAALCADIAHLVNALATSTGRLTNRYGMLVLPEAFAYESVPVLSPDMRARATGALRELCRFLTPTEGGWGYAMNYVGTHVVDEPHPLRMRTRGDLFRATYLFDTRNTPPGRAMAPNPLRVPMASGIAPTVAYWIRAMLDEQTGNTLFNMLANRDFGRAALGVAGANQPVCGSVGAYSFTLPKEEILEQWRARLARQALEVLIPHDENDNRMATDRKGGQSSLPGRVQAKEDWTSWPAASPRDAGALGSAWQGDDNDGNAGLWVGLALRSEEDWRPIVEPPYPAVNSQDAQDAHKVETDKYRDLCQQYFYKESPGLFTDPLRGGCISLERPANHGNNVRRAADALKAQCDRESRRIVDVEVRPLVERWVNRQVNEDRMRLNEFVQNELNGDVKADPREAVTQRSGKLGWVLDFLQTREAHLRRAVKIYEKARAALAIDHNIPRIDSDLQAADVQMQNNASRQRDYIRLRQKKLVYERRLALCQIQGLATESYYQYTRDLRIKLEAFKDMLRYGAANTHQTLAAHEKAVAGRVSAKAAEFSHVRHVVRDPDWEQELYRAAVGAKDGVSAVQRILHDLTWSVGTVESTHRLGEACESTIQLTLDGFPLGNTAPLDRNVIGAVLQNSPSVAAEVDANVKRLMARCRVQLHPAPTRLSILGYMLDRWNGVPANQTPQALATKLLENCEVNLRLPRNTAPFNASFVISGLQDHHDQDDPADQWLNKLNEALQADAQVNGANQALPWMASDDPTTLTALVVRDLVPIEELEAYSEGMQRYQQISVRHDGNRLHRSLLHAYPAEENVLSYDPMNLEGGTLVPARVTALLERPDLVDRYLLMLGLSPARADAALPGVAGYPLAYVGDISIEDHMAAVRGWIRQFVLAAAPGSVGDDGLPVLTPTTWDLTRETASPTPPILHLTSLETFCLRNNAHNGTLIAELHDRLDRAMPALLRHETGLRLSLWETGPDAMSQNARAILSLPSGEDRDKRLTTLTKAAVLQEVIEKLSVHQDGVNRVELRDTIHGLEIRLIDLLVLRLRQQSAQLLRQANAGVALAP